MNEKQFNTLINKLDMIVRLLTITIVKDAKSQKQKILMLSSHGFRPSEIADLLGTTANTVRVTLSKAKERRRAK